MIREKWAVPKEYKQISVSILQENLSALRAKAGLSQEELSNIIGISRQSYYALENGKTVLPWKTYLSLVLFYHEINVTRTMMDSLDAFPVDLFLKFNG